MAESFACKDVWVHFSNEAVERLITFWVGEAERQAATPGMTDVSAFLQDLLVSQGDGCRAFGLYREYLPDELSANETLGSLAYLLRKTLDKPRAIDGIVWTDELEASWRERLQTMLDAVTAHIAELA